MLFYPLYSEFAGLFHCSLGVGDFLVCETKLNGFLGTSMSNFRGFVFIMLFPGGLRCNKFL